MQYMQLNLWNENTRYYLNFLALLLQCFVKNALFMLSLYFKSYTW